MRWGPPIPNPGLSQQAVIRQLCNRKPFLLKMRLNALHGETEHHCDIFDETHQGHLRVLRGD